jgi:hypothetical protein
MTLREWVLGASVGLLTGLAPGCSHTKDHAQVAASSAGGDIVIPEAPRPAMAKAAPSQPDNTATGQPQRSQTTNSPAAEQARISGGLAGPDLVQQTSIVANRPEPPSPNPLAPVPAASRSQNEIKPMPVEDPPLVAALRCYLNKKPAEAVIWLERYDRLNQDLLFCLLPLIARLSEQGLQKSDRRDLANVVAQLERLTNLLRPAAQLTIDKMCFCDQIDRYGVYHALDEDHAFQPGEVVQVYVELQNYSSFTMKEKDVDYRYCIQLASRMEIRDFNGQIAWCKDLKDADRRDESLTPRRDFFINYPLQVPRLPPGPYTLWLIVTDVPTKRKTEHTLDFRIITARGCEPYSRVDRSELRCPDASPAAIPNRVREEEL